MAVVSFPCLLSLYSLSGPGGANLRLAGCQPLAYREIPKIASTQVEKVQLRASRKR